jgi:high-affinity Fe2+/Pb2+ permease
MQLELNLSSTLVVSAVKAQRDLTLWRIEQENKVLKEVEAKLTKLNQKLEQQEQLINYYNAA